MRSLPLCIQPPDTPPLTLAKLTALPDPLTGPCRHRILPWLWMKVLPFPVQMARTHIMEISSPLRGTSSCTPRSSRPTRRLDLLNYCVLYWTLNYHLRPPASAILLVTLRIMYFELCLRLYLFNLGLSFIAVTRSLYIQSNRLYRYS